MYRPAAIIHWRRLYRALRILNRNDVQGSKRTGRVISRRRTLCLLYNDFKHKTAAGVSARPQSHDVELITDAFSRGMRIPTTARRRTAQRERVCCVRYEAFFKILFKHRRSSTFWYDVFVVFVVIIVIVMRFKSYFYWNRVYDDKPPLLNGMITFQSHTLRGRIQMTYSK